VFALWSNTNPFCLLFHLLFLHLLFHSPCIWHWVIHADQRYPSSVDDATSLNRIIKCSIFHWTNITYNYWRCTPISKQPNHIFIKMVLTWIKQMNINCCKLIQYCCEPCLTSFENFG
jgi:hypothetical protein